MCLIVFRKAAICMAGSQQSLKHSFSVYTLFHKAEHTVRAESHEKLSSYPHHCKLWCLNNAFSSLFSEVICSEYRQILTSLCHYFLQQEPTYIICDIPEVFIFSFSAVSSYLSYSLFLTVPAFEINSYFLSQRYSLPCVNVFPIVQGC